MVSFHILFLSNFALLAFDLVESKCIRLDDHSCLSIQLKYNWTSLAPFVESNNQTDAKQKLKIWRELQVAPTCWHIIAPFLCHAYHPKCSNGTMRLPCRSICLKIKSVCGIVPRFFKGNWPNVLNCDFYPSTNCFKVNSLKNHSFDCHYPLVKTNYKKNWYNGIEGCGLGCKNQFFTDDEHRQIYVIIAVLGSMAMFSNLFSVATFLIDWKAQSKYPAKIIFFMNLCFCLSSCGWLLQFLSETRRKITCREDGTKRIGEPGSESGYGWCLFTFILIYYCSFAGIMWFVMLSYAWHNSFRTLGSTKDQLSGKKTYFHVLSWMIPVISTTSILILEEVDADPLAGICFVGVENHSMLQGFVLVPFGICLLIGEVFMIRGTVILFKVKGQNLTFLNGRASTKIKETIIRISFFSVLSCFFFIIVFASHVQETTNRALWETSLMDFVRCEASKAFLGKSENCTVLDRPNLTLLKVKIISAFGAGITVSTWSWTKATIKTWKKAWIRFRGIDVKKRIQNSFNARRNRKRINPMVEQAFPAIALAVPMATKAAKRGSIASIASQRRGSVMKISSFVSGIADEIRSKLKTRSVVQARKNDNELQNSPVLMRHRDGRRRSLLSIESLLTASSQGKLRLRRGSLQTSATSGSEFGLAFGHMWSVQPQLNVPTKTRKNESSRNLRVIRLGEDMPTRETEEEKGGKMESRKKKKGKAMNKIDVIKDADTCVIVSSVSNSNRSLEHLPPLKRETKQSNPDKRGELREPRSRKTENNKGTGADRSSPLRFFHETFVGPSKVENREDKNDK